ncbi:MAG: Lrp/AsnC family transcriptional regulator [Rhodocyclaceae bacterium]|nr:MAG: Lrp/AsnC family transcriptional regulator [Rhodocyclaceae bacterium]
MTALKLDRTDRRILDVLQREGDISNVQLAERVNLSPAPCLRRVAALKEAGVIQRTVAMLDPLKLGFQLLVFVSVKLVKGGNRPAEEFFHAVSEWTEVLACHAVTGDMDYLLKVQVTDLQSYNRFMSDKLLRQSGVIDIRSSIAIEQLKETSALPLDPAWPRPTVTRRKTPR